jgi:hypothetical protein
MSIPLIHLIPLYEGFALNLGDLPDFKLFFNCFNLRRPTNR